MSFVGMGPMEIMIILVVALIFLGPERMIDAAKLLGKAVREGRNLAAELPRLVIEDDDVKLVNAGKTTSVTGLTETRESPPPSTAAPTDESSDAADGPVAFSRRSGRPSPPDDSDGT